MLFSLRPGDRPHETPDGLGIPVVSGAPGGPSSTPSPWAVQHPGSLGRTRIATVTGPDGQKHSAAERLAGVDDPAGSSESTDPSLTTVHQDVARVVFDRDARPSSVVVPSLLVPRYSA
ncbi:hypothetical protein [Streptomyces sp. NRRL B-24085]|uniref:hypothetical protein n=1 Tax=Streptomyces sp. NRRL B-24085 TaxID=1709476 RepID=UPI0006B3B83C|nr:hypothetical protein [Streptomyces sp. NRRL B-24085]